MLLDRRAFLLQMASASAALAGLAAVPSRLGPLVGGDALAATGLSGANRATLVAACEAVCSFDGRTAPPSRVDGRPSPTASEVADAFATEYAAQMPALQQGFGLALSVLETGSTTPPPLGATSTRDAVAYRGRPFSALGIPLRLRLLRSWGGDLDRTPFAVDGFDDVGSFHRAVASAVVQACAFSFYQDRRTWPPLGYGGPWIGRRHPDDELPFSHHDHRVERVFWGGGVTA